MVQKKKEKRRKRKRKGRKKNLRRMRKKHESSKSVGSRSHQPYSPFVFHARRPRVLFLLQSRDHEGMVLDMHPPGIIRGPPFVETIRPVINPGKFVNSRTQENDATVKDHHHSRLFPLPSPSSAWKWYFESCRESPLITLVITIPFIIRGRFDGWHYSKDKRAMFSIM